MLEVEKLEAFVSSLLEGEGLKLRRSIGVGPFLYNKLRDHAPPYLLEVLLDFDRLSFEKKKVILEDVKRFLREYRRKRGERKELSKKPLKTFLTPVDKLDFLSGAEKKILRSLGLNTVLDVLYYFPLRY